MSPFVTFGALVSLMEHSLSNQITDSRFWQHIQYLMQGHQYFLEFMIHYFSQTNEFQFDSNTPVYEDSMQKVIQLVSDLFLIRFEINLAMNSRILIGPKHSKLVDGIVKLNIQWTDSSPASQFIQETLALNVSEVIFMCVGEIISCLTKLLRTHLISFKGQSRNTSLKRKKAKQHPTEDGTNEAMYQRKSTHFPVPTGKKIPVSNFPEFYFIILFNWHLSEFPYI